MLNLPSGERSGEIIMSEKKRSLYRIPSQGKVSGVCAGISEFLGIEVWLVRVLVASAILFTGIFGLPLLAYVVACFLLESKKGPEKESIAVKSKIWQSGETPRRALHDIQNRFTKIEKRVRRIEQHVTSPAFHLKREIDRL